MQVSIKWRVAVKATLLCMATIFLVGMLQAHFMRKELAQVISSQQFTLVSKVAEDIDSRLSATMDAISAHALIFPREALKSPSLTRDYFARLPVMLSLFDDLMVLAPDGTLIADFPELPARKTLNAHDMPFFQQVLTTRKVVISEPVISKTRREPIINVSAPIITSDGRVGAVLVGVLRLYKPNFLGNLGDIKIGKTGYFTLLTKGPNPVYVAHPDKTRILQPRPPGGSAATTRALEGYEGSSEDVNSLGVSALFTSKTLHKAPWVLVAVAPTDEFYASLAGAADRLLIIVVLVGLLMLPLVWLMAWRAMSPLAELRDAIVNLSGEKRTFVPVRVTGTDEFGDLTRAFNSLMHERMAAEATLHESESHLQLIADNMPALISFLDRDLRFTFANKRHLEWFGKAPAELINRSMREVFGNDTFEPVRHHYEAALKGERVSYDRERPTLGRMRHIYTTLIPHFDETRQVTGIFKLTTDVTEHKEAQKALHELARLDPLTGLCNRRDFDERLPTAVKRNARNGAWLALMFVDVDYFKTINDTKGHAAGDDVLQEFAKRLSRCVRDTDTVARFGGDEFTVILEGLHEPAEAAAVGEKILLALEGDFTTRAGNCKVSCSIGIALCPSDSTDIGELLRQADEAVYAAKKQGRNRCQVAGLPARQLKLVANRPRNAS